MQNKHYFFFNKGFPKGGGGGGPFFYCKKMPGALFGANLTLYLILCSERSMQCLGPQVMFRRIKKLLYLCLSVRKN